MGANIIPRDTAPEASAEIIASALEDDMVLVIFGSNRIERAGMISTIPRGSAGPFSGGKRATKWRSDRRDRTSNSDCKISARTTSTPVVAKGRRSIKLANEQKSCSMRSLCGTLSMPS